MTYCSVDDVKTYLGIEISTDDELIRDLIAAAQSHIEARTTRIFEAASDSVVKYTVGVHTINDYLYFDRDFCAITSIKTDLDNGSGGDTIPLNELQLLPVTGLPYYAVKILGSSSYTWTYTSNPDAAIQVTGRAAYSTTAPANIQHACKRLAAYYYRQKDAQVFDTIAVPDAGIITVPVGEPADIKAIIDSYIPAIAFGARFGL